VKKRWQYSNILKLSRAFKHQDDRHKPPIPQIVFYQHGVGTNQNIYSEYIEGATGASLAEKVQEAYAFIAHNYQLGDEIYLFGFSRGAYTARMVATFIGEIGVLDRKDMDHFADIFVAFQKKGSSNDQEEIAAQNKILEPFTNPKALGRVRSDADGDTFTINALGVFDTVGSLGLPKELSFSHKIKRLFGFRDKHLGEHIEHAFHAMALNETRADFDVNKFEQSQKGREKGQVLKQVWFAGSHSDIGGGWQAHDLADITLTWMASNIEPMLALDLDYLRQIPQPVAAWGQLLPHDSRTGIFHLGHAIQRTLPTKPNTVTNETVHPSTMHQTVEYPQLMANVNECPELLGTLSPLEESLKDAWPYVPGKYTSEEESYESETQSQAQEKQTLFGMAKSFLGLQRETMEDEGGRPRYEETWLGAIAHELK